MKELLRHGARKHFMTELSGEQSTTKFSRVSERFSSKTQHIKDK